MQHWLMQKYALPGPTLLMPCFQPARPRPHLVPPPRPRSCGCSFSFRAESSAQLLQN